MSPGAPSVVLRRERTRGGIERLDRGVREWVASWDGVGPQASQIERCCAVLKAMVARLAARVRDLPTGELAFAECRAIDGDTAVVERLWRLFADRFGQRRAPSPPDVQAVVAAADELIWSCVLQARTAGAAEPPPLPLAYIEPAFSASATPRTRPPATAPVHDRQLAEALRMLPVPLIGLPVGVVAEPWWLAVLAHEVGHHVQFDLDAGAVDRTQALLEQHGDDGWGAWRLEAFADAFSVAALGPAAVAVIAELEWSSPARMAAPAGLYPPAIVRLALVAEVARALGGDDLGLGAASWDAMVAALDGARRPAIAAMLAAVPAAARALVDMPLGGASLRALVEPPSDEWRELGEVMERRLAGEGVTVTRSRRGPRMAAAAAFLAYRRVAAVEPAEARHGALAALRTRTLALIDECADRGTRTRDLIAGVMTPAMDAMLDTMFERMREMERESVPTGASAP